MPMEAQAEAALLDELSNGTLFLLIGILALISAYFSGSETAFMSINRYRLHHLQKDRSHDAANRVVDMLRRPDRLLGTILIGNNVVNIFAASLATILGLRLFGDWGPLVSTLCLTLVFLIFAEITPKTVAAQFPERFSFLSVYLLQPMMRIMFPMVLAVNAVSNSLARLFGAHPDSKITLESLSNEELVTLVHEGADIAGKGESMLLSILEMEKVSVEEVMVAKASMATIDINNDIPTIVQQICTSQHTRIPIVRGGTDQIIGILHMRDANTFLNDPDKTKASLLLCANGEPSYVIEGTSLLTQLLNFQRVHGRLSLVVNEYGEVLGLISLSDILEEIVGKFTTDPAASFEAMHRQDDNTYMIGGGLQLRTVNRELGWSLPTSGSKTLSGLIIEILEMIPERNICVEKDGYRMETVQISDHMIKMVKVWQVPDETSPLAPPS